MGEGVKGGGEEWTEKGDGEEENDGHAMGRREEETGEFPHAGLFIKY